MATGRASDPEALAASDASAGRIISTAAPIPRFVSASELQHLVPIAVGADALAAGLLVRESDELDGFPRSVLPMSSLTSGDPAEMLLMPAQGPEGGGVKLVSIVRGNEARGLPLIQGLYVLLSRDGLTPEIIIDGAALTNIRTAAVSALATRQLARPDSSRLVVFGAGRQAEVHVEAMRGILPIEHVTIVGRSRNSPRAVALVEDLIGAGIGATLGDPTAVADADVICTCTTSTAPLFDDAAVAPGTHVNGIGAYRLDMREIPMQTLSRALVVVESISATLIEAGDVVDAIRHGALPEQGFAHELSEVLSGEIVRSDEAQVTVFKSVGLAAEDLVIARAVADALQASES